MTPLRGRMIEDMKLAGLAATTQGVYLEAVKALSKHFGNRPPDQLSEEEVRQYLLGVRERSARQARGAPQRRPCPGEGRRTAVGAVLAASIAPCLERKKQGGNC